MKKLFMFLMVASVSIMVQAKVKSETVLYNEGANKLEGAIYFDEVMLAKQKKLPAVVIVHNWMGVGDYVKMRANQMAELGYIAFVADIYGQGIRPKNAQEASALAGKYKGGDRQNMHARAKAAFDAVVADKRVDGGKVSVMGYCFGGTVALEMARMGLPLVGAISFHGGLGSVSSEAAKNIKAKVLVLHGAIDPYVPATEVAQFQKEMDAAKVNYEFVSYSGAVHAFTEKEAGSDITKGAAYNEQADKRSFIAMKNFLTEVNQ